MADCRPEISCSELMVTALLEYPKRSNNHNFFILWFLFICYCADTGDKELMFIICDFWGLIATVFFSFPLSIFRAAEYMTRTGNLVNLEVARQGAIYHGLATLLNQPSPVMHRGECAFIIG